MFSISNIFFSFFLRGVSILHLNCIPIVLKFISVRHLIFLMATVVAVLMWCGTSEHCTTLSSFIYVFSNDILYAIQINIMTSEKKRPLNTLIRIYTYIQNTKPDEMNKITTKSNGIESMRPFTSVISTKIRPHTHALTFTQTSFTLIFV